MSTICNIIQLWQLALYRCPCLSHSTSSSFSPLELVCASACFHGNTPLTRSDRKRPKSYAAYDKWGAGPTGVAAQTVFRRRKSLEKAEREAKEMEREMRREERELGGGGRRGKGGVGLHLTSLLDSISFWLETQSSLLNPKPK